MASGRKWRRLIPWFGGVLVRDRHHGEKDVEGFRSQPGFQG